MSDEVLQDLNRRLEVARFGEDLEDTQFQYGFPASEMKKIVNHWMYKFKWRKQEDELNRFPQFKTNIEGIDVHFLHVKPKSGRRGKLSSLSVVFVLEGRYFSKKVILFGKLNL